MFKAMCVWVLVVADDDDDDFGHVKVQGARDAVLMATVAIAISMMMAGSFNVTSELLWCT